MARRKRSRYQSIYVDDMPPPELEERIDQRHQTTRDYYDHYRDDHLEQPRDYYRGSYFGMDTDEYEIKRLRQITKNMNIAQIVLSGFTNPSLLIKRGAQFGARRLLRSKCRKNKDARRHQYFKAKNSGGAKMQRRTRKHRC